ncbi:carboxylesterase/lipase family protein [Demequina sp. NBRC 110054]|uniref:carboxylesterase/lipase family protein n=1 Tax=Demequina sp. NBRC 110054 TaxID=1570343 RepID=UPI000A02359D|nr:carboxylesterase family protein [Demequina sp. NBRC 110054]
MNAAADRPVVRTESGAVRGFWEDWVSRDGGTSRSARFLGIPYAEPPVGDLRFLAPAPRAAWSGVRDAVAHGATPQRWSPYGDDPFVPEPSIPGDDLLSIDVGTPDPSADVGLPVLVYIHGGGFVGGSHASPWYQGHAFHRDGVVTVAFSYRLGYDGFGWIDGAPHNRGVLDWMAALAWVQRNIRAFGGDPSRVTIAGQSAGGAAVMRLLTMPAARGLFAGALALSPADTMMTVDDARRIAERGARGLGVTPDLDGMRAVPERTIIAAQDSFGAEQGEPFAGIFTGPDLFLSPAIDGDLIPEGVAEALASGVGDDVALLVGATAHEFNHVTGGSAEALADVSAAELLTRAGLPEELHAALIARSPRAGITDIAGQAMTDAVFRRHVARWADLRARGGAAERTWAYDFRWCSPMPDLGLAVHCLDLPFGFDILNDDVAVRRCGEDAPQELADAVHGDWLTLIETGRVEASAHAADHATVFYGDPDRGESRVEAPGYAQERVLAEATTPAIPADV